ncbi:MAG: hypothetical protein PHI64_23405 [Zoogloea sp.]|uniref:hypothetical protein n=1 Tax=Zoogloea sp. TaxID=49181 RepID=UPI002620DA6D|nr:hypothetical protein [Zoogloea sp.]MDD2991888.1 hypothetical protein [Zoogloea sp.]
MPEPTTTTGAAAVAGGLITVAGIATGLPSDLILPSFVGALWALRFPAAFLIGWGGLTLLLRRVERWMGENSK